MERLGEVQAREAAVDDFVNGIEIDPPVVEGNRDGRRELTRFLGSKWIEEV